MASNPLISIVLLTLLPVVIVASYRHQRVELEQAHHALQEMGDKLKHLWQYDLRRLESSGDRLTQLSRLTGRDSMPLKLVSEASSESRKLRELPLLMPQPCLLELPTLLRLLELLQPASSELPPCDLMVRSFKVRKDRGGFAVQMSLTKRELK